MKFNDVYKKYTECCVLSDDELEFLIKEFSELDKVVRDKHYFLGFPTTGLVGIELRRLEDMQYHRNYNKKNK